LVLGSLGVVLGLDGFEGILTRDSSNIDIDGIPSLRRRRLRVHIDIL
jgi:hypothetical protein